MAVRKIEVNEDDLKKVILMLKYSKPFVKLEPTDLFLGNLWRVAPKIAEKLMRVGEFTEVENKGRKSLKYVGDISSDVPTETSSEELPKTEEVNIDVPVSKDEQGKPTEEKRVPRCRKRKSK